MLLYHYLLADKADGLNCFVIALCGPFETLSHVLVKLHLDLGWDGEWITQFCVGGGFVYQLHN